jgi:hypothetical protein
MKKPIKWTFIGLGIFVAILIVITIAFLLFLFVSTGIATFAREFTPETKEATKIEEEVTPNKNEKDNNLIINDLAYIKILCLYYTDDADPETDGISIDIGFYDNKSEDISFYDIPIEVNIKIYAREFNLDTGEFETEKPPVYEGTVEINHSMRLSEMFGNYIRVPFEDIGLMPDKESTMGILIVRVITPLQGEFEAKQDWIVLEPY